MLCCQPLEFIVVTRIKRVAHYDNVQGRHVSERLCAAARLIGHSRLCTLMPVDMRSLGLLYVLGESDAPGHIHPLLLRVRSMLLSL